MKDRISLLLILCFLLAFLVIFQNYFDTFWAIIFLIAFMSLYMVYMYLAVKHQRRKVEGLLPVLEQLLRGERDEDGGGAGGEAPLYLDEVLRQRQGGHQALLLLEVQPPQDAVVLLGDALGLEHIGLQLLLGAPGVHHQECHHEHPLVLALQFL